MPRGSAWVGLVTLAAAALTAATPRAACACDCAPITPSQAEAEANVVFIGTARKQEGAPEEGSPDPVTFVFDVEDVVKGAVSRTIRVQTNNSSDACGVTFQLGERYEVYALDADGTPFVTQCGGTHRLEGAAHAG